MKKIFVCLFSISLLFFSCSKTKADSKSIAVFVPGIMADSPVYAMLADGVSKAVESFNESKSDSEKVTLFIFEAGTNQAEWSSKIIALASEQKYDVIISANSSLPDLVKPITQQFPNQKFILLDAECEGNKNIYTVRYNQYQQSYLTGYIAGLMSKSHKLALIAAQEYPVMNNVIFPYFKKGALDAYADTSVDFRIVGNWYDATKGAMIADSVIQNGVDVILPICGGAAQGVINSAKNNGIYITWFDNNGFARAPETIISSTLMLQDKMAEKITLEYLNDQITWGAADMVGMEDGFIDFVQDDSRYIKNVPADIRAKMANLVEDIKQKKIEIK